MSKTIYCDKCGNEINSGYGVNPENSAICDTCYNEEERKFEEELLPQQTTKEDAIKCKCNQGKYFVSGHDVKCELFATQEQKEVCKGCKKSIRDGCYNGCDEQKEEWGERFIKEFGMHFEFHEDELQFAIEFIREERQKVKDKICRVLRQIGEIDDDDDMEKTINLIKKL